MDESLIEGTGKPDIDRFETYEEFVEARRRDRMVASAEKPVEEYIEFPYSNGPGGGGWMSR